MNDVLIGKVKIEKPICLAPMAGTSSVTYRGICHEKGASYSPTELCSARSIVYNGVDRSYRYLEIDPANEGITCIQLFGSEAEDFSTAIKIICEDDRLAQVDIIDINMGCPVPKVVKTSSGSGLLKEPERAEAIVKASKKAADEYGKPVTVKTRIGFNDRDKNGVDFARRMAESGADMICVHGRTAAQMYSGKADIDMIARMRDSVREYKIPFFANGDIVDGESARKMLKQTDADGIMIGRAAMGNPWIFEQVRAYLEGQAIPELPSYIDRCDMLIREVCGTASKVGEVTAVKEMRSVMPHYIKGLPGAATVKVKLCAANTIEEVRQILDDCRTLWS